MKKQKKRQQRRSISVKGITYARMSAWCSMQEKGQSSNGFEGHESISGFVEQAVNEKLDALGAPKATAPLPRAPRQDHNDGKPSASGVWTF